MARYALNPYSIRVMCWNIAKGRYRGWQFDLASLAYNCDIALIQEARLEHQMQHFLGDQICWAFAPGFSTPSKTTGVLTLSRATTLRTLRHQHREPLLRLPKAALVTEYRLQGLAETLMVANIHAINFTTGTRSYRRQLRALHDLLEEHCGPLIVSGDFNIWRHKRQRVVDELLEGLELQHTDFDSDHRKQAFGFALDHLFYRGLTHKNADTYRVPSSDHNPIIAELEVTPTAPQLAVN